ncbi:MAG: GNAT family N-acetyltransferase [Myxococcaceae bacterium]|nr:GNAT family N-acetyltransferase [Myxococcaceae bacterium]MCI0670138.1 GNAT family N-acetyltransferase [Myxococcaceae bacterium]
MQIEWQRSDFTLSTDRARLDLDVIHGFLSETYWSPGVPRDVVVRAIEGSLAFGLFHREAQVGFARVVTDRATFAYLADVFVLESYRGQGLARWMMDVILAHPELQGLRRWMLATRDAHGLYEQVGFTRVTDPQRFMQRWDPEVYRRGRT